MAIIDKNGNWYGKIGDYLYYVRNGKQLRRRLPTPHKGSKTEGMKTEFGTVTLTSKHLRKALEQECANLGERYLSQQVNALLFQVKNCDPAPIGSRTPLAGLETPEGKALFNRFTFHQHRRKFPKLLSAVLQGTEMEVIMNSSQEEVSLTELLINLITGDFRRHDYRLTPAEQKNRSSSKENSALKKDIPA